jgi:hypothetical protein
MSTISVKTAHAKNIVIELRGLKTVEFELEDEGICTLRYADFRQPVEFRYDRRLDTSVRDDIRQGMSRFSEEQAKREQEIQEEESNQGGFLQQVVSSQSKKRKIEDDDAEYTPVQMSMQEAIAHNSKLRKAEKNKKQLPLKK